MQTANPYQPPAAAVADQTEEYGEVKILSATGRLGRVRYIGYSIGVTILVYVGVFFLGLLAGFARAEWMAGALGGLGVVALLVLQIMLTVQRCHDFNASGWVCLVAFIPLAALVFWFIPGTRGPNRYGPPPPPNSTRAILLASILPLIFVVGIVAAIALPAYQKYAQRAHQSAAQNPQ
jgi:uncharacterized membrane protein YhaH (DUF805 family)